jgi:uncharacterized membrane protein
MVYGIKQFIKSDNNSVLTFAQSPGFPILSTAFVVILVIFSSISTGNAQDNDSLPHTSTIDTPYFTNSELLSYSFLQAKGDESLPVYSDYQSTRYLFALNKFSNTEILSGGNIDNYNNGYLLLRVGELRRKKTLTFGDPKNPNVSFRYKIDPSQPQDDIETNLLPDSRIYSDGYVQIFLLP